MNSNMGFTHVVDGNTSRRTKYHFFFMIDMYGPAEEFGTHIFCGSCAAAYSVM